MLRLLLYTRFIIAIVIVVSLFVNDGNAILLGSLIYMVVASFECVVLHEKLDDLKLFGGK